ncbi:hypothetical protein CPT_Mydo_078 [Proteus phage Mydo]|uniref:Uncharacterized protein n=1 Tax=Proteus phage Mydo TaxID=2483610 RepID=A0A3G8F0P9_9CAUD|nr:hypothetical protein HWB97_gp078 [Proteus phage Mydo]AZF87653.1 hypothetical protein CPT_Mydo_078 [Proteus phage Mydo]
MTNMIYTVSKTSILRATLLACLIALVSNTCFNCLACLVTTETMAQGFNTMIDVLQLTLYTLIKLNRFKRLDRYDLPFVIAGLLAIAL